MTDKRLLEELIEDYQKTHHCDIDTATYYTMAILVDAVASGMSPLKGMHKRIFEQEQSPWHTGTPTGKGYYLIKYQCQIGKLKGNITYRAVKRYKDDLYDGFVYEDGGIGADDIWKPIEWQKIEENEDGRTD